MKKFKIFAEEIVMTQMKSEIMNRTIKNEYHRARLIYLEIIFMRKIT